MAAGVRSKRGAHAPGEAPARVIHLYGISSAPGPSAEVFRSLKGVDGSAPVEALEDTGFACWISRVPADEFARNLAENMQNLDWLAATTTRHQQVISAIAERTDVLPARFGIEFLDDKSLRAHVESRQAALKADLKRILGKEEWGIKVFALPVAAVLPKRIHSGKEYLQAKSALIRAPERTSKNFGEFSKALESIADDMTEGGKLAAARRDVEFNKTLLLNRANRKKLASVVRRYSRKWKDSRRVECTGPWPPFSFVSQPQSSE
jgi:hypothetical protein